MHHIGTGTVVDRMLDWFTLEGKPRPVTRAKYDWQVYDPHRKEKGGVRWHTVEGPAVLKRKGLYYEMFSGGNWQNTTYGVSYAISPRLDGPDEWLQFSDGTNVMPILRTLPEAVIGPGHNCVVRGPNNRELYCVYHRWTDDGRVMAIDRMDFAGDRIFVIGPSHSPQPAPFEPKLDGFDLSFSKWQRTGEWRIENGVAISGAKDKAELALSPAPQSFLCEITVRCVGQLTEDGSVGIKLGSGENDVTLTFHPSSNVLRIEVPEDSAGLPTIRKLPDDFDWNAPHLLRIDVDYRHVCITLDAAAVPKIDAYLAANVASFSVHSENQSLAIDSLQYTEGFEELFETAEPLADKGWQIAGDANHAIENGALRIDPGSFQIEKHPPLAACEFAANFRLLDGTAAGEFGLILRNGSNEAVRFAIDCEAQNLKIDSTSARALPDQVVLSQYHQLRIIKASSLALCYFDDVLVETVKCSSEPTTAAVFCKDVRLAIEMIRLTAI